MGFGLVSFAVELSRRDVLKLIKARAKGGAKAPRRSAARGKVAARRSA